MFSATLRIRQQALSLLGTSTIYTNIAECSNSKVSITKRSYNTQHNFDEGAAFPGPTQSTQGAGLGEHSEGWLSVLMCPLVQEAACTTAQGSPCGICRIPSPGLGNSGRRRTAGPGRTGLFSLSLLTLPSQLGRQLAGSAGCASLAMLALPSTGWRAGPEVCLHSIALIKGVSVYSVTNSVTIPPFEDLPLPFDSR